MNAIEDKLIGHMDLRPLLHGEEDHIEHFKIHMTREWGSVRNEQSQRKEVNKK